MTTASRPQYKVIGTRPVRPDGIDKVTGRAIYGADISLPGSLRGRVKRSPHAHAIIKSIDASKALALPGVHAVVTSADLVPAGKTIDDLTDMAQNVLAGRKVLYRGHAVAAVAAVNDHVAQSALDLIEVEYEVLPAVLEVREAMAAHAPILNEKMRTRTPKGPGENPSNVVAQNQVINGDSEKGFAEAEVIVEGTFSTQMVHQGYIEPQAATRDVEQRRPGHDLDLHAGLVPGAPAHGRSAQPPDLEDPRHPHRDRRRLRRQDRHLPRAARRNALAEDRQARQAARWTASKCSKAPARPLARTFAQDRRHEGRQDSSPSPQTWPTRMAPSPVRPPTSPRWSSTAGYDIPNVQLDGYDVLVNKPRTQDYRAPSSPAAAFAFEQLVDELSEKLGIDPLKLRLQNSAHEGTRGPAGMPYKAIGHEECLEAAIDSAHYRSPLEGPNRGRGVASGFWFNVGLRSSVTVTVQPDGTVSLIGGNTDIGGTRASLAMQLAETLGIAYDDVKPTVVDTDSVGYNDVTAGSRVTFASGMAAHEAGKNLLKEMIERLAPAWQMPEEDITYADGSFTSKDGSKTATFKQAADLVVGRGPGLTVSGSVNAGFLQGGGVRAPHRGCRSRPGDRQGHSPSLHRHPGRRHGRPPVLRRGPAPGRRRPGHRLGAERGVLLRRQRPDGELELPRLPHSDHARRAEHRDDSRRSAEPAAPVRCPRRR